MNGFDKIFLCDFAIGKEKVFTGLTKNNVPKHLRPYNVIPEFDSVFSSGDRTSGSSDKLFQDERIVYHPSQIIIRYVVTFTTAQF